MTRYQKKPEGRPGTIATQKNAAYTMPETRDALSAFLAKAGVRLQEDRLDLLWRYHLLIRKYDTSHDLTRLTRFEDFAVKHYLDCLIVLNHVSLPSPLLDIGTGAGFPGIPLKIARPQTEVILSEGRAKRREFLDIVIRELGLTGIRVTAGITRGKFPPFRGGVITRALETADKTLERVGGFLDTGSRVILMKGPGSNDELRDANERFAAEFRPGIVIDYTLGGTRNRRRLIDFEKITPPRVTECGDTAPTTRRADITSAANPSFKQWKSLLSGRGIKKHGSAIVAGDKIVREIMTKAPASITACLSTPAMEEPEGLPASVQRAVIAPELFAELDVNGTHSPLVVVRTPEMPCFDERTIEDDIVLLIPFQDPANVGAVIRSAAAFGFRSIVLLDEAATPFHPKSLRAAGSALFSVRLYGGPSIRDLSAIDRPVIALSQEGADMGTFVFPARFALLAGMEGPGLAGAGFRGATVCIGMEEDVESMNAAVAVAVTLYELRSRRGVSSRIS